MIRVQQPLKSYEVYYVHLFKNVEYESELEANRAVYTAHRWACDYGRRWRRNDATLISVFVNSNCQQYFGNYQKLFFYIAVILLEIAVPNKKYEFYAKDYIDYRALLGQ